MDLISVCLSTRDPILLSEITGELRKHDDIQLSTLIYDHPVNYLDTNLVVWDLGDETAGDMVLPEAVIGPEIPILFLAWDDHRFDINRVEFESLNMGGYLLRSGIAKTIGPAVEAISAGLSVYPAGYLPSHAPGGKLPDVAMTLSPRETSVLRAIAVGSPSKAIASDLGISERTVKFHLASLYRKLGVQTRTEAAIEGARRGIVPL
jgi:DNA-binding NarL/FixJ family response regulator